MAMNIVAIILAVVCVAAGVACWWTQRPVDDE